MRPLFSFGFVIFLPVISHFWGCVQSNGDTEFASAEPQSIIVLDQEFQSAQKSYDVGDYDDCLFRIDRILDEISRHPRQNADPGQTTEIFKMKANALAGLNRFQDLEPLIEELRPRLEDFGLSDPDLQAVMAEIANIYFRKARYYEAVILFEAVNRESDDSSLIDFVQRRLDQISSHQVGTLTGNITWQGTPVGIAHILIQNGFYSSIIQTRYNEIFQIPIFDISEGSYFYFISYKEGFGSYIRLVEITGTRKIELGNIELSPLGCGPVADCGEVVALCFSTQIGGSESPVFGIMGPRIDFSLFLENNQTKIDLTHNGQGVYRVNAAGGPWTLEVNGKKEILQVIPNKTLVVPLQLGTVLVD